MEASVEQQRRSPNNEIKEALDSLKSKNAQLRESISYLQKENAVNKVKYNRLKQQLSNLNTLLEKNVKVLNELFIDNKSAFQMCKIPILNSPVRRQSSPLTKSPQAGPSTFTLPPTSVEQTNTIVTRRRLYIEPLDKQELQQMLDDAAPDNSKGQEDGSSLGKGFALDLINFFYSISSFRLSTILEENTRELSVKVARLPPEVVEQHLQKQHSMISNCSWSNINDSFASKLEPTFSSTPLKLEAMKRLGLMPSPNNSIPEFVSVRKKDSGNTNNGRINGLISPKKERISSPEKSVSAKKENVARKSSKRKNTSSVTPKNDKNKKKKRENVDTKPESGRPTRQAKPKTLKEESLKKKKRRS